MPHPKTGAGEEEEGEEVGFRVRVRVRFRVRVRIRVRVSIWEGMRIGSGGGVGEGLPVAVESQSASLCSCFQVVAQTWETCCLSSSRAFSHQPSWHAAFRSVSLRSWLAVRGSQIYLPLSCSQGSHDKKGFCCLQVVSMNTFTRLILLLPSPLIFLAEIANQVPENDTDTDP